MTESPKVPGDASPLSTNGTGPSIGRRRWLQAGISAAPVIMTVASRPVLATTDPPGHCHTPSGFQSGNISGPPPGGCRGKLPSYWTDPSTNWPNGYTKTGTHFNPIFDPDLSGNPTLFEVLGLAGPPFQSYIVAALLNNAALLVPESTLSAGHIKAMWTEVKTGDMCFPVATGICWNEANCIAYLLSTMD